MTAAVLKLEQGWQVHHPRVIEYPVIVANNLLALDNPQLLGGGRVHNARRFIVLDANVAKAYAQPLRRYFAHHQVKIHIEIIHGGEAHKTFAVLERLLKQLDTFPLHRRDEPILAIGGGVLTDLVGFAAAMYRRGLPHIRVPTTVMGYVDAAIGVKTGINFNHNKNRLGHFEPPAQVLLDPQFLASLPSRHVRNGVAEIIKLAVIRDAALFAQLETCGQAAVANHFATAAGQALLNQAVAGMLQALTPNLFEADLARDVDFGHTFSYGLEAQYPDDLFHGEAVLLDILLSCVLAQRRQLFATADLERVLKLVQRLAMSPQLELLNADLTWQTLADRINHRNGQQHIPIPTAIGQCQFLNDVTYAEIAQAIADLHQRDL